jgi:hypothetical protein
MPGLALGGDTADRTGSLGVDYTLYNGLYSLKDCIIQYRLYYTKACSINRLFSKENGVLYNRFFRNAIAIIP